MKVRVGRLYRYEPCFLDKSDGHTSLTPGDIVRVRNCYGCPPCQHHGALLCLYPSHQQIHWHGVHCQLDTSHQS